MALTPPVSSVPISSLPRNLILIAPSPCYRNIGSYTGGFQREDLESIFDAARESDSASAMHFAPLAIGKALSAPVAGEFTEGLLEIAETEGHLPHLTNPDLILGILRRHLLCAPDAEKARTPAESALHPAQGRDGRPSDGGSGRPAPMVTGWPRRGMRLSRRSSGQEVDATDDSAPHAEPAEW